MANVGIHILCPLGLFYGHSKCYGYLVYFVVIWYIFPRFGMLYQEKSGNPAADVGDALNPRIRDKVDVDDDDDVFRCVTKCFSSTFNAAFGV
jgi:hypothetical protein